jgi:hypothetical protein
MTVCPACKLPKFAFVFLPDWRSSCTDCHRARLGGSMAPVFVEEQHTVRTVVANKWVFVESRAGTRVSR